MPASGLHWLSVNNIFFYTPSKTEVVAEAWNSLVCAVDKPRRHCFLCPESKSTLHTLPKDEDMVKLTPLLLFVCGRC